MMLGLAPPLILARRRPWRADGPNMKPESAALRALDAEYRSRLPPSGPLSILRHAFLVAVSLTLCTGCAGPRDRVRADRPGTAGEGITAKRVVVGSSVEGRLIECFLLGDGHETVFIMAGIHGNEPAGTPLVARLREYLIEHTEVLEGRRVLLMPAANPDGLIRGNRHNVRGVDLNRNFPATNFQGGRHFGSAALSEPESVAIHRLLLEHRPARVVSLHQPINYGSECIDYDGPGRGLALAMAAVCDLPVKKLGGRHGSLGSYVGLVLGVPIITVELPKEAIDWSEDRLWRSYGEMLLAAVRFRASADDAGQID